MKNGGAVKDMHKDTKECQSSSSNGAHHVMRGSNTFMHGGFPSRFLCSRSSAPSSVSYNFVMSNCQ